MAHAHANGTPGSYQERGVTALGCYGPLLARPGDRQRRGGRGSGGGNKRSGAASLLSAKIAGIRTILAAQHNASQAQRRNTPGNPQLGETCLHCSSTGRDHYHSHLTCAWHTCALFK